MAENRRNTFFRSGCVRCVLPLTVLDVSHHKIGVFIIGLIHIITYEFQSVRRSACQVTCKRNRLIGE